MALDTFSKFYYGYEITNQNKYMNFNEGSGELTAVLTPGIYSPEDLAVEIKTQFDGVGVNTYTVSFNRSDRKFTIATTVSYTLLIGTGSNVDISPWVLLGFNGGSNLTGSSSYASSISSGSEYKVQFKLQDYTRPEDWVDKVDAAVNQSASGYVEVVSFGTINFTQFSLLFITNKPGDGRVIRNNPTGVNDANDFLSFLIKRGTVDFMPDENTPNTFYKIVLESTPENSKGTSYRLKEEVSRGLRDYYSTGVLKFRVLE